MTRRLVSSGSSFEKVAGFSRAVADGDWVFVSGTTGFDYATMTISDDLAAQAHQAFRNVAAALKQAGADFDDVVRVKYYFTEQDGFDRIASILSQYLGKARPAATALVCKLVDPRIRFEVEVTARKAK
jgi:enamine deaminase RidA (YjgF/YER057c/UK114 family)